MRLLAAGCSMLLAACGAGVSDSDGVRVYRQPVEGGNTFSCSTCHALEEPAADGVKRVGHPIGGAPSRPSWKNGKAPSFLAAVNSCRTEWMGASEWTGQEGDFGALRDLLSTGPNTAAVRFTIAAPPAALSGGDAARGRALFNGSCSACHGKDGAGALQGPNLAGTGLAPAYIAQRVRLSGAAGSGVYEGLTGGRMPFWSKERLSDDALKDLVAYVSASERGDAGTFVPPPVDAGTVTTGCGKTHPKVGWVMDFTTHAHGVKGRVTVTDDCTLTFTNFSYDGNGIDVRAYGAKGGNYGAGFPIGGQLYRPGTPYVNSTLTLALPAGKTMNDVDGVSVWCVAARFSFGDGTFRAP